MNNSQMTLKTLYERNCQIDILHMGGIVLNIYMAQSCGVQDPSAADLPWYVLKPLWSLPVRSHRTYWSTVLVAALPNQITLLKALFKKTIHIPSGSFSYKYTNLFETMKIPKLTNKLFFATAYLERRKYLYKSTHGHITRNPMNVFPQCQRLAISNMALITKGQ